jgi:hypothetical protein
LFDASFQTASCNGNFGEQEIKLSLCEETVDVYPCISTFSESEQIVGIKSKDGHVLYRVMPPEEAKPWTYIALPPAVIVDVFITTSIAFGYILCCYRL